MTVKKKVLPPLAASIDIEKKLNMSSPLVERVVKMVKAYERWQSKLRDRRFIAVRTRQAIVRKGVKQTITDAITERPSDGFQKMVKEGKPQMTYEWIALEHPKIFTKEMLQAARDRLDRFGVKRYPGWEKPGKLVLKPIPAGAQAILDKGKAKPTSPPVGIQEAPEKRPRGWNLKDRAKKAKAKDMADATT